MLPPEESRLLVVRAMRPLLLPSRSALRTMLKACAVGEAIWALLSWMVWFDFSVTVPPALMRVLAAVVWLR